MEDLAQDPSRIWKTNKWAKDRARCVHQTDFFPALEGSEGVATTVGLQRSTNCYRARSMGLDQEIQQMTLY